MKKKKVYIKRRLNESIAPRDLLKINGKINSLEDFERILSSGTACVNGNVFVQKGDYIRIDSDGESWLYDVNGNEWYKGEKMGNSGKILRKDVGGGYDVEDVVRSLLGKDDGVIGRTDFIRDVMVRNRLLDERTADRMRHNINSGKASGVEKLYGDIQKGIDNREIRTLFDLAAFLTGDAHWTSCIPAHGDSVVLRNKFETGELVKGDGSNRWCFMHGVDKSGTDRTYLLLHGDALAGMSDGKEFKGVKYQVCFTAYKEPYRESRLQNVPLADKTISLSQCKNAFGPLGYVVLCAFLRCMLGQGDLGIGELSETYLDDSFVRDVTTGNPYSKGKAPDMNESFTPSDNIDAPLHKGDECVVVVYFHYKDDAVKVWFKKVDDETDDSLVVKAPKGRLYFDKSSGFGDASEVIGPLAGKSYDIMTPNMFLKGFTKGDLTHWHGLRVMSYSVNGGEYTYHKMKELYE